MAAPREPTWTHAGPRGCPRGARINRGMCNGPMSIVGPRIRLRGVHTKAHQEMLWLQELSHFIHDNSFGFPLCGTKIS